MPPTLSSKTYQTYQDVIRDFLSVYPRQLTINADQASVRHGQPNLIISKSKGKYKGILPHSLITFGEGEQCHWYIVINPPRSLSGLTGHVKYLYEINLSGSTNLTDPTIGPESCFDVIKRANYEKYSNGQYGTNPKYKLVSDCSTWQHEAELAGIVTGQGSKNLSSIFHIRQSANPNKPLKPELRLPRVCGSDFFCIHHNYRGRCASFHPTLVQTVKWSMEAVKELKRIHELGIIHRDISLTNLMLDRGDQVRFVDFGFGDYIQLSSRFFKNEREYSGHYISLEDYMLKSRTGNTTSSDVYALGLVLGQMFGALQRDVNIDLFEGNNIEEIVKKFYDHRVEYKSSFMKSCKEHFGILGIIAKEEQDILQKIQEIIFGLTATFDSNRLQLDAAYRKLEEALTLISAKPQSLIAQSQAKVVEFNPKGCGQNKWRFLCCIELDKLKMMWANILAVSEVQRLAEAAAVATEAQKLAEAAAREAQRLAEAAAREAQRLAEAAAIEAQRLAEVVRHKRVEVDAETQRLAEEEAYCKAHRGPWGTFVSMLEANKKHKAEDERRKAAEASVEVVQKLAQEASCKAERERAKANAAQGLAEEARRKAEEACRKAEEACRKAEEEARRKAEEVHRKAEEARRKEEEEALRKVEEETRRKAEEVRYKAEEACHQEETYRIYPRFSFY